MNSLEIHLSFHNRDFITKHTYDISSNTVDSTGYSHKDISLVNERTYGDTLSIVGTIENSHNDRNSFEIEIDLPIANAFTEWIDKLQCDMDDSNEYWLKTK